MRFAFSPYAQSFYVRKIRNRILSDNYKGIAIVSEKNILRLAMKKSIVTDFFIAIFL
ncbi:hypothetical protein UF66_0532 [Staphylococcus cohnii subsp. cohnii]|uniref:Uncharacterized protein n=1 Tax=Staphylococcus cohnii subsp. cohnii TaxID=74704 RepID=A0A0M2NZS7_STACC|nr:hypothetical protein UF66_0532 [Staphylococcus cohnii subsp. cohnii]